MAVDQIKTRAAMNYEHMPDRHPNFVVAFESKCGGVRRTIQKWMCPNPVRSCQMKIKLGRVRVGYFLFEVASHTRQRFAGRAIREELHGVSQIHESLRF